MLSKNDGDAFHVADNPNSLDYFDKNALGRNIEYETGDIDFGIPSIKKTIDKVVIRYKSNAGATVEHTTSLFWGKDGEHALEAQRAFLDTGQNNNIFGSTVSGSYFDWHIREFKPGSDAKNIYSFSLGIKTGEDDDVGLGLMIDSIQIFYKQKGIK